MKALIMTAVLSGGTGETARIPTLHAVCFVEVDAIFDANTKEWTFFTFSGRFF